MQCISPLKASQNRFGDVVYTSKQAESGLVGFSIPCRKCLACRLNTAREKAIRCWHESQLHEKSCFLTLTYSDEHLESPKLDYEHFRKFMKDLRERLGRDSRPSESNYVSMMVTGEYGEKNKRPHWHVLLFNYWPSDARYYRQNDLGDALYISPFLDDLWGRNDALVKPNEFGEVTMESAGYVARYASKKLVHGHDGEHEYEPIHETSKGYPIGRGWIEKHCEHTFKNGFVVLPNGSVTKIPRYYVDWCKRKRPDLYKYYVTEVRPKIFEFVEKASRKEELEYLVNQMNYKGAKGTYPKPRAKVKDTILKSKFKRLQENLKL